MSIQKNCVKNFLSNFVDQKYNCSFYLKKEDVSDCSKWWMKSLFLMSHDGWNPELISEKWAFVRFVCLVIGHIFLELFFHYAYQQFEDKSEITILKNINFVSHAYSLFLIWCRNFINARNSSCRCFNEVYYIRIQK